jgi:hypothetical protein
MAVPLAMPIVGVGGAAAITATATASGMETNLAPREIEIPGNTGGSSRYQKVRYTQGHNVTGVAVSAYRVLDVTGTNSQS